MDYTSSNSLNVILLLTRFHVHQLHSLKDELKTDSAMNIIYYGNTVKESDIKIDGTLIEVPIFHNTISRVIGNPLQIIAIRKEISNLDSFFGNTLIGEGYDNVRVILFSRHGFLPQVLIRQTRFLNPTIVEIEEGLAFYSEYTLKDHILVLAYRLLSAVFLGFVYEYKGLTGRHPKTDIVYARFPLSLPKIFQTTEYKQIPKTEPPLPFSSKMESSLLLFTSPFSEYDLMRDDLENSLILEIVEVSIDLGLSIHLKIHPKESLRKYEKLDQFDKVKVIEERLGEGIDYSKYPIIIHFGSSIFLDILSRGYSSDRLLMIDALSIKKKFKTILKGQNVIDINSNLKESVSKFIKNVL